MKKILIIIISSILLSSIKVQTFAQNSDINTHKLLKTARKLFNDEKYSEALKNFLQLDSLIPNDNVIKYKVGACYLNSKHKKTNAIPYLEAVSKDKSIEEPKIVFKELGTLYHLDYQFDRAITNFQKYISLSSKNDKYLIYAKRMIKICNTAKKITSQEFNADVENVGYPISTKNSELNPLISSDESIMFFTRIINNEENSNIKLKKYDQKIHFFYSNNNDGVWSDPIEFSIPYSDSKKNISLAGLSPDGTQLFINIYNNKRQDIYSCEFIAGNCINLKKLNKNINSKFNEGRVSITPDRQQLYFSSDRPGGFGGKDIYTSIKKSNGEWGKAINLNLPINSIYDDGSPFIHPDGKTIYFSSKGHETIGGCDIFKSKLTKNNWSEPKNIGFPNTTKDDLYFVLTADGQSGYYSSIQNNLLINTHIYKINLKGSIPLTLVKGRIFSGDPKKPICAKIKVIDNKTNTKIKYVYNPNPKTGRYLMIFPPDKNYDMIVEAKNYLPQRIHIYIPNQTYFYELFQEIHLRPITSLGKKVGENISVNNTFYDIYKTPFADSIIKYDTTGTKDYDQLLKLVEDIINTTDSIGIEKLEHSNENTLSDSSKEEKNYDRLFSLIEKAIETTDTVSLQILDENTLYNKKSSQSYFYATDNKKNNLQQFIIDEDTIYTVPTLYTKTNTKRGTYINNFKKKEAEKFVKNTNAVNMRTSKKNDRKIILEYNLYFNKNKFLINKKYIIKLNQISELLINNPSLGIEIFGYADTQGEEYFNLNLSIKRANSVLKFFVDKNIDTKRTIIKGFGESKSFGEKNKEQLLKNRKVDIKIFDVITKNKKK
ncbi:MAG: PD40 domain-containing protein [Bacteroidetes bacterium]|nr:PD40 domain-containing protein [Bacteroidota bacterium]